jgi:hypothetical protein
VETVVKSGNSLFQTFKIMCSCVFIQGKIEKYSYKNGVYDCNIEIAAISEIYNISFYFNLFKVCLRTLSALTM